MVRVKITVMEFYLSLNKYPFFHLTTGQISTGQLPYTRPKH